LKIYEIAIVLKNHEEPMYVVISTFPLAHSKKRFTHKEDIKPWIANILEATQAWRNTMSPEELDFLRIEKEVSFQEMADCVRCYNYDPSKAANEDLFGKDFPITCQLESPAYVKNKKEERTKPNMK
jgi:hypothetical protein